MTPMTGTARDVVDTVTVVTGPDRGGGTLKALHAASGARLAVTTLRALAHAPSASVDRAAAQHLPAWRAEQYVAARTLLRRVLAESGHPLATGEPIVAGRRGRPLLPGATGTAVSLSHSGEWVAAAVLTAAPGGPAPEIGVDVQTPCTPSPGLVRRCCQGTVPRALASLPDADLAQEFAWIWSAQEACVKATGQGLAGRPWTIPVRPGERSGSWRHLRWRALRGLSPVPLAYAVGPVGAGPATRPQSTRPRGGPRVPEPPVPGNAL